MGGVGCFVSLTSSVLFLSALLLFFVRGGLRLHLLVNAMYVFRFSYCETSLWLCTLALFIGFVRWLEFCTLAFVNSC